MASSRSWAVIDFKRLEVLGDAQSSRVEPAWLGGRRWSSIEGFLSFS